MIWDCQVAFLKQISPKAYKTPRFVRRRLDYVALALSPTGTHREQTNKGRVHLDEIYMCQRQGLIFPRKSDGAPVFECREWLQPSLQEVQPIQLRRAACRRLRLELGVEDEAEIIDCIFVFPVRREETKVLILE